MIEIVSISPNNELPVAESLKRSIAAAWPDVATSRFDRVTILAGVQTLRDVDLLVFVELREPRSLEPRRRRDGTLGPRAAVQAAAIAIEVKQLDPGRFTTLGNQIFPDYAGSARKRSVNAQIGDAVTALRAYVGRYGVERFFVHGVGWLTEVDEAQLRDVSPWIVGRDADWLGILDAAAQQSESIYGRQTPGYVEALATIRETLSRKRVVSPRDRARTERLSRDVIAQELVENLAGIAGTKQIRLIGRGGSGKTTTLVLLADRLASVHGERVLILTFHKALRGEIEHLVATTVASNAVAARNIAVETTTSFFLRALAGLGVAAPVSESGAIDFGALDRTLAETRLALLGGPDDGDAAALKLREPQAFAWDYIFVDEAQDWTDAERDFLRALYGPARFVLADGLEQLVRRQTPCDWLAGIPSSEREQRYLGRSLRMAKHLANFANAVARESGLGDWRLHPVDELPGGRVIVALGRRPDPAELFGVVRAIAEIGGAAPVDTLACVPPRSGDHPAYGTLVEELVAAGERVWDGTVSAVRETPPESEQSWRIVQYDSCRGLEGWVALSLGLDVLLAAKAKHPNLAPGEVETPDNVARRWLMIALTRAVQTLVITIDDPNAPIVATLRAAAAELPAGVVEWLEPPDEPADEDADAEPLAATPA
jgi:hypothetical protein